MSASHILACSVLCALSLSCTTMPLVGAAQRQEMTGLEEMSFEYIKGQWGEPDAVEQKDEGRIVHYKNIRSEDSDPISGQVTAKVCTLRLALDKSELVSSWEYETCEASK